jgi:hypothetical protein
LKTKTPPHIAGLLRACRESYDEMQQFWSKPRIGDINFKVDMIWVESDRYPNFCEEARYCVTPIPHGLHVGCISKIIRLCPQLKVLYLTTEILNDNDEFEYCRRFTNREPTTLAEARNWIEESAHQRLQEESSNGLVLPKIILIDQNEIKRTASISLQNCMGRDDLFNVM